MTTVKLLDFGPLTISPITHEAVRLIKCADFEGRVQNIHVIGLRALTFNHQPGSLLLLHPCEDYALRGGCYCRNLVMIGFSK